MRLFLALNFSASVRDQWYADAAPLRALDVTPRVRWTPSSQLHLTVAFLAEQPPTIVEPLSVGLRRLAAAHPALDLLVGGVGAFPDWKRARVLWLAVARSSALEALVADAAVVGRGLSLPGFERPFHPHVTLGRVADGTSARTIRALAATAATITS